MNAPVPMPRPEEVSDAQGNTTATVPEHHLKWPCIILLVTAVLVTVLWNVALGWLVGRVFGLW